jgi:hypothetical protein
LQTSADLAKRFAAGLIARSLVSPRGFTFWGFPLQAAASFLGHYDLSKYMGKDSPARPFRAITISAIQTRKRSSAYAALKSLTSSTHAALTPHATRAASRIAATYKRRLSRPMSNMSLSILHLRTRPCTSESSGNPARRRFRDDAR